MSKPNDQVNQMIRRAAGRLPAEPEQAQDQQQDQVRYGSADGGASSVARPRPPLDMNNFLREGTKAIRAGASATLTINLTPAEAKGVWPL